MADFFWGQNLLGMPKKKGEDETCETLPRHAARAMEFNFNLHDIKKLFTASSPALPESDAEMVLEADRAYAEGGGVSFGTAPLSIPPPATSSIAVTYVCRRCLLPRLALDSPGRRPRGDV
jgi:hypothetical protein